MLLKLTMFLHIQSINTDWVGAVKQLGLQHSHNVSVSGGGEKANFRMSAGFDTQEGSVIGQHMNRFTTRVAFDYFISDRITVTTNYSMTYTKNKQNSSAISTAMRMMPNMAIYYEDENGNPTDDFYFTLPSIKTDEIPNITNPVAVAALEKNYSTSLSVNPEFSFKYNIFGLEDGQHRLTYDGRITFQIQNSGSDSYYPAILTAGEWAGSNSNRINSSSNKSTNISTTHTLTFVPTFKNRDHSVMAMVRYQMNTNNNKSQSVGIYGVPSGSFESTALDGIISSFSTGAGRGRSLNGTFSGHYAYKGNISLT